MMRRHRDRPPPKRKAALGQNAALQGNDADARHDIQPPSRLPSRPSQAALARARDAQAPLFGRLVRPWWIDQS